MLTFNEVRNREREGFNVTFPAEIDGIRESFFDRRMHEDEKSFYYTLGGAVFGPLYTFFCEWAVRTAKKEGIKTIFPLMREGELYTRLLKRMASSLGENMRITPLWVSRRSSYAAMCYGDFNRNFFREICLCEPRTIAAAFRVLGLDDAKEIYAEKEKEINDSLSRRTYGQIDRIYDRLVELELDRRVNRKIADVKALLGEYLKQNGATEDFITLDFGSTGRLPQAIDNCCPWQLRKIHLFLKANRLVLKRLAKGHDIRFRLVNYENETQAEEVFCTADMANHLFETLTMGNMTVGTAAGYQREPDGTVRVIHGDKVFRRDIRDTVSIIQDGIVDFCGKYIGLQTTLGSEAVTNDLFQCGLGSFARLVDAPFDEEAKKLGWLEYDDSVCGCTRQFIPPPVQTANELRFLPNGALRIMEDGLPKWRQGSAVIALEGTQSTQHKRHQIVIYGYGRWGQAAVDMLRQVDDVHIVCIVDQKKAGKSSYGCPIISIDELGKYEFEDVIIASTDYADEIRELLCDFAKASHKTFCMHNIVVT